MPDLDLLLAYLHIAAIFLLVGVLSVEWVLLRVGVAGDRLKQLAQADRFYGAIAGIVIITGLLRVFLGYAGAGYYAANWVFWTKMALFVATGLLSAPATMAIIKWHSALEADGAFTPKDGEVTTYRRLLYAQIAIVLCIPLLGLAMGYGYGA